MNGRLTNANPFLKLDNNKVVKKIKVIDSMLIDKSTKLEATMKELYITQFLLKKLRFHRILIVGRRDLGKGGHNYFGERDKEIQPTNFFKTKGVIN